MNKFAVVLTSAFVAIAAGVCADAADSLPVWAYPVNPPGLKPASDDGSLKHVPNSAAAFTLTQIRDLFSPPDWHPDNHPAMPDVGVRNGQWTALMKSVVAELSEEDMAAIAAYTASLAP